MPSGVPGFEYKEKHIPLPALHRETVNPNDDEEIELGLNTGGEHLMPFSIQTLLQLPY